MKLRKVMALAGTAVDRGRHDGWMQQPGRGDDRGNHSG